MALSGGARSRVRHDSELTVITEKDGKGAGCDVTDKWGGAWHLLQTPGTITVRKKGIGPTAIAC